MKKLAVLFALLGVVGAANAQVPSRVSVGAGRGVSVLSRRSSPCNGGVNVTNFDGTSEELISAYLTQPPYYGAFAECFDAGAGESLCGIQLNLSNLGGLCRPCDVYVWADSAGHPGGVLSVTYAVDPCPVGSHTIYDIAIAPTNVSGLFWVGFWADIPDWPPPYGIAADTNGVGISPLAPQFNGATGWDDLTLWRPEVHALGIGAWFAASGACCDPSTAACTYVTQAACAHDWLGYGTLCAPNPCPLPARVCCVTDVCFVTTANACLAPNVWHAEWAACDPNPCSPPPTGSCCTPAGTCTVTLLADCTGTWTVAGICTPNPCAPSPPVGMVWIPSGNVRLGQAGISEPVNDFYVEGFYIDRDGVSNIRYKTFIDAGGYQDAAYWNPVGWAWRVANGITLPADWNSEAVHGGGIVGNEQFPVNDVSWWEADAYCRWAGGRLPTEAEWEKAAKGGCETHGDPGQCDATDTPSYPWGEGLSGPRANYMQSGDPYDSSGFTTPVGYYDGSDHGGYQTIASPSPYGLNDVAGNVWEWCSTEYADYPYHPNDGREDPPVSGFECCRVLRGGSWDDAGPGLRCAFRDYYEPGNRNYAVGFRCAKSGLAPPPTGSCCDAATGDCTVTTYLGCAYSWDLGGVCTPSPCTVTRVDGGQLDSALGVQAKPNPFGGRVSLRVAGPGGTAARVLIFDAAGRLVRTAWSGMLNGRAFNVTWDGRDDSGRQAATGIYMVRLESGSGNAIGRLVKLR